MAVYFNESPIGHCLASVGKGAPNHDGIMVGRTETATVVCGGVRVRECARVYTLMISPQRVYRLVA